MCQDWDRNSDPNSDGYLMAETIWYSYVFRYLDFCDTFFFVLRRKTEQITFLHVLHHFLMPTYAWIVLRYKMLIKC